MATRDLPRRVFACVLLIAALFTALQALDYHQDVPSNDTYQYAKQTLRILGESPRDAVHGATELYCQDSGNDASAIAALETGGGTGASDYSSVFDACMYTYRDGLSPSSPRYLAIFTSRPGYPLLAAPLADAFGLRFGLWSAALLSTLLASLLVLALLRAVGCGWWAAVVGQGLYLAAPTGYWGSRMLTDGPSLATILLMLLGAVWMVRGRMRAGAAVLAAGLAAGFLVRYSSEQLAALLLAVGALLYWWRARDGRTAGIRLLAITAGAGFVLTELLSTLLGWPGMTESMQDTFTKHFARPDVSDPVLRLIKSDVHLWIDYPVYEPTSLLAALGLVLLAVVLVRREAIYGALVVAAAATGLGAVVAHPVASQTDRLMVAVWLLLALGLPPLFDRARTRPGVGGADASPESAQLSVSQPSSKSLTAATLGEGAH